MGGNTSKQYTMVSKQINKENQQTGYLPKLGGNLKEFSCGCIYTESKPHIPCRKSETEQLNVTLYDKSCEICD